MSSAEETEKAVAEATSTNPTTNSRAAPDTVPGGVPQDGGEHGEHVSEDPTAERRAARVSLACRIYKSRLDRALFFRPALFGEAGWDALLAIYIFGASGRTLSAGQLCQATSEVSLTSAIRLQRRLADVDMIRRFPDPADRRRMLVELTPAGQQMLEDYLDHLLDHKWVAANEDDADDELHGLLGEWVNGKH
jgi:DNA-binding MarR family transcriptional regulator